MFLQWQSRKHFATNVWLDLAKRIIDDNTKQTYFNSFRNNFLGKHTVTWFGSHYWKTVHILSYENPVLTFTMKFTISLFPIQEFAIFLLEFTISASGIHCQIFQIPLHELTISASKNHYFIFMRNFLGLSRCSELLKLKHWNLEIENSWSGKISWIHNVERWISDGETVWILKI